VLPVLVLTMHAEEQYAVRALRAGAAGYLTKDSAPQQLVEAIRKVVGGNRYLAPELAEKLALDLVRDQARPLHVALSDREFQVLGMIAAGESLTRIAADLCLSVKTVSTHRSRILKKMGMKSNAELVRYALEHRLLV
jgi:two-component system invasion response regulator UvrY